MLIRSKNWDMSDKERMYAEQVEVLKRIVKESQKTIERLENTVNQMILDMVKEHSND